MGHYLAPERKKGDAGPSDFSTANLLSPYSFNWFHRKQEGAFFAKCLSCLIPAELVVESNARSKGGPSK